MSFWNETNTKELLALWESGHSASLIAAKLGVTSRSAVLGKLHRIGAPKRPKPLFSKSGPVRQRSRYVRPNKTQIQRRARGGLPINYAPATRAIKARRFVGIGFAKTHNLKRNMCRWPNGNPGDDSFHYCGHQKAEGKSYCADHFNISVKNRGAWIQKESLT